MRRERAQFAVVIDEHGGTAGVVTLEDLFEEVVGEIDDSPERRSGPRRDAAGRLRVPGTMRLDELGQVFDLDLVHEDVDSVSGLILTLLGRPPRVGDTVRYDRLELEVTAVMGHGVEEAAVTLRGSEDDDRGLDFGLAQHLARDRRGVSFAERQELHQVDDRVAFGPAEVGVRQLAGRVADVEQQRGDRVRDGRARGAQDAIAAHGRAP